MKFSINEVFCEILSGLALLLISVVTADVFGWISAGSLLTDISSLGAVDIMGILIVGYLAGLFVDIFGFSVGNLFLDKLAVGSHTMKSCYDSIKLYWASAQEHVFAYRELQWAYYSLYRNLLILLICGLVPIAVFLKGVSGSIATIVFLILAILAGAALFSSMRALIRSYYNIPAHFKQQ